LQDIGLFAVTESQCTEDEHDDEDEDDSKFRNFRLNRSEDRNCWAIHRNTTVSRDWIARGLQMMSAANLSQSLTRSQTLLSKN